MSNANDVLPAIHGILVTYRRPKELAATLQRLAEQSRRFDSLTVVDNDQDDLVEALVREHCRAASSVDYVAAPTNLGPAGGLALGMERALHAASDRDWIVFLDDDNPPRTPDLLAEVTSFGEHMIQIDPAVGAVGLIGARFGLRAGLGIRVLDSALRGPLPVDYVGGGQLPCFRVSAVRDVGPPDPRLFFGFDDLEYGLRLRSAGHRIYVSGELWHRERAMYDRLEMATRQYQAAAAPNWRDYYHTRNLIWILRGQHSGWGAARVVFRRVVGKPLFTLPRCPKWALAYLTLGLRATFDGYTGRMGRTVEPAIPPTAR